MAKGTALRATAMLTVIVRHANKNYAQVVQSLRTEFYNFQNIFACASKDTFRTQIEYAKGAEVAVRTATVQAAAKVVSYYQHRIATDRAHVQKEHTST
jgi:hypothetical protein